ncbi:hypothetical protein GTW46_20765 [Streptomyces sp. SID6013]|nr:hypothetical protein [Streptomyces sp. SID6013]
MLDPLPCDQPSQKGIPVKIKRAATITATLALAASGIALTTTPATAAERTLDCALGSLKNGWVQAHCPVGNEESGAWAPTTFKIQHMHDNDGYHPNATVKCAWAQLRGQSREEWLGEDCKIVS